ncbi:hypothetical protein [Pseudonocardia endophytica]|uniref:Uncharacterized protein n=1 Tax=Pseudonocardia endophytica TaxID=401976 RepID=A0A4V2PHD1_PSEEN|nr:hypothetical protein [Pseudonocardia endophytica]TCK20276.1 hypothetical protein EV378_4231 [Pseudonocardia endophytica]
MTAFSATGLFVPAPRAATPQIPTPRRPVDTAPDQHPGRHRIAEPVRTPQTAQAQQRARSARATSRTRTAGLVTIAARTGSVVTLAAMLVAAAATAGLTDGVAPTGDAATVASSTLR